MQPPSTEGFQGGGKQGNAQCLGNFALGQIGAEFNFLKGLNFNLKLKKKVLFIFKVRVREEKKREQNTDV